MKACNECLETFKWDDDVVNVGEHYFHSQCVELVPSEHVAFVNDEYIGVVEYEDTACFILNTEDYEEDDSE